MFLETATLTSLAGPGAPQRGVSREALGKPRTVRRAEADAAEGEGGSGGLW